MYLLAGGRDHKILSTATSSRPNIEGQGQRPGRGKGGSDNGTDASKRSSKSASQSARPSITGCCSKDQSVSQQLHSSGCLEAMDDALRYM